MRKAALYARVAAGEILPPRERARYLQHKLDEVSDAQRVETDPWKRLELEALECQISNRIIDLTILAARSRKVRGR